MYPIFLLITLALSIIMAIDGAGTVVAFATGGLGFPLLFSATAFVYGLCAWPAVALREWGGRQRSLGFAASAALSATAAFAPAYLSQWQAERAASTELARDRAPSKSVTAASLEIRRRAENYDPLFMDREACGHECRVLLSSGQVEWVRVVMLTDVRKQEATSTFYRLLHGDDCSVPNSSKTPGDTCVLMAPDNNKPAEMVIEFGLGSIGHDNWVGIQSVSASLRLDGKPSEVFRKTEIDIEPPIQPTIFGPKFDDIVSYGVDFMRERRRIHAISFSVTAQVRVRA